MSLISIVTNPDGSGRGGRPRAKPSSRSERSWPSMKPTGTIPNRSRGLQQPRASTLAGAVVVEAHLPEACERVAHVRFVVDREPSPALRVDGREGAVRESGPLRCAESRHDEMLGRPGAPPRGDWAAAP